MDSGNFAGTNTNMESGEAREGFYMEEAKRTRGFIH